MEKIKKQMKKKKGITLIALIITITVLLILTGVTSSVSPDLSYFYGEGNISNYYNEDVISKIYSKDTIKDALKIVNEQVPHIGLYRNKGTIILNLNVGGEFSPNSNFLYYNFDKWYRQQ